MYMYGLDISSFLWHQHILIVPEKIIIGQKEYFLQVSKIFSIIAKEIKVSKLFLQIRHFFIIIIL